MVQYAYLTSSGPCQLYSWRRVTLIDHCNLGAGVLILQLASLASALLPICWHFCALELIARMSTSASRYIFIFQLLNQIDNSQPEQSQLMLSDPFIEDNNNFIMFDKQKMKDLQQRSHNRGLLSKQFYHNEQQELERKRKEMKDELDRQVEQRRRKKEQEKLENQKRIRKEEEDINNYYKKIENREKRISGNESTLPNMKNSSQPYQTYPNDSHHESRAKALPPQRNRGTSKPSLVFDGDIPLLPVMPAENTAPSNFQVAQGVLANSKSNINGVSSGAIPLLDLSQEPSIGGPRTKKGKKTKRQKTLEFQQKQSQMQRIEASRPQDRFASNNDRRSTLPDEQSIMGSIVKASNSLEKKQFEVQYAPKEIDLVEQQNNALRMELKKNQEAVTLLMGAMRSNGKLDKFRAQAQKILTGNQNMQASMASRKQEEKKEETGLMLPRISLKHQSIMHDYLLSAARRGKKSIGK